MYTHEQAYTTEDLHTLDPVHLHTADLVQRCRAENERCCCGQPQDSRYAYELFRRAMVEQDEVAWGNIQLEYAGLVETWVVRCGGMGSVARRSVLVAAAFARFRRTDTHFDTFPTLTALLHHLQFCAAYVVVEAARTASEPPIILPLEHREVELARVVGW